MCKYYTAIRVRYCYYYCILHISRRGGCGSPGRKQISGSPDQLLTDRSQNLAQQAGLGHATQSGSVNQVAGDAAAAHGNPNLKSVSDRSTRRRTMLAIKLSDGHPSDLRHLPCVQITCKCHGSKTLVVASSPSVA
ncbi:hypothetical protein V8C34DRAFT_274028 [Trichoderma compactum]